MAENSKQNEDLIASSRRLITASTDGDLQTVIDLVNNNPTVNINTPNENGDTALHCAARSGHVDIVECLLKHEAAHINCVNKDGQTAVHCAVEAGSLDIIELLYHFKADLNSQDKRGLTALHIACRSQQSYLAVLLLELGCNTNIVDEVGEAALHMASCFNLLKVVQVLCAYGCQVDKKTKNGLTALHIAAKQGYTEVVRSLILAGANPNENTQNGVQAEELARARGHGDIADLLSNLTASMVRDRRSALAQQLLPTSKTINRIRINVFGSSGVGKTTLIESLKCGFIRSLFRRSGSAVLQSAASGKSFSHTSLSITDLISPAYRNNYQQPANAQYTRGINVQQANISVVGDVSLWEFSGYESYYVVYDRFLGDSNAVYMVVVSSLSSANERMKQLEFWLNFIRTRMVPVEPIGYGGVKLWAPRVIIVMTHGDLVTSSEKIATNQLLDDLRHTYATDLVFDPTLFILDANQAMGVEMKQLRQTICDAKTFICEGIPKCIGILDPTLQMLPEWRRVISLFPVVSWEGFTEYIRSRVNLLATEDHIRELMNQLHVMGEVHYMVREEQELIVISPQWLCTEVIGHLLSYESLSQGPVDGLFSADQLRTVFSKTDPADIIYILDALELCAVTQRNGYYVYNMFSYNRSVVQTNQQQSYTDKDVVGGFRVEPDVSDQLINIFQRVLYSLTRRLEVSAPSQQVGATANDDEQGNDQVTVVEHWSTGARVSRGQLVANVQLSVDGHIVTVVICGPKDLRQNCFFFQEDLCEAIYASIETCCPALYLERSPLSVSSIRSASEPIYSYPPSDVILAQIAGTDTVHMNSNNNSTVEQLVDIVAFGDSNVFCRLQPGIDQVISFLPLFARYCLATLLDDNKTKNNWSKLASEMGVPVDPEVIKKVDNNEIPMYSLTDGVIGEWARLSRGQSTIRELHQLFTGVERPDAVHKLISLTPLYRYVFSTDETIMSK